MGSKKKHGASLRNLLDCDQNGYKENNRKHFFLSNYPSSGKKIISEGLCRPLRPLPVEPQKTNHSEKHKHVQEKKPTKRGEGGAYIKKPL